MTSTATMIVAGRSVEPSTSVMFRIATERKNVGLVKELLCKRGLDFTILFGEGGWRGSTENSMIIELSGVSRTSVQAMALVIKRVNQQEAVLLQEFPVITVTLL